MTTTNSSDELDEILIPPLTEYLDNCILCQHHEYLHFWNGGGSPEHSGYDECRAADCKCEGRFDNRGKLITKTLQVVDETQLARLKAAILSKYILKSDLEAAMQKVEGFERAITHLRRKLALNPTVEDGEGKI